MKKTFLFLFLVMPIFVYSQSIDIGDGLRAESMGGSLKNPWDLRILPDGNILVSEKFGILKLYNPNTQRWVDIQNIPSDAKKSGQGGFLGLEIDPNFDQNNTIYLAYSRTKDSTNSTLAIIKARLNANRLENIETIFESIAVSGTNHYGGVLLIKDNQLIVGTGERNMRTPAQDRNNKLGTMFSIDLINYSSKVISYGHRNVQGITLVDGELLANEHGPMGGDEINLILQDRNFGWPLVSYGKNYDGSLIENGRTQMQGVTDPLYQFTPSIAPSGMIYYKSNHIPNFKDKLLVGALKFTSIYVMNYDKNSKAISEFRRIDLSRLGRIRRIREGKDGELYVICDEANTPLYKITYIR